MAKEPAACWFDWHEVASLSSNIDASGAFIGLTDTGILVAGGTKHSKATDTIYLLEQTGETEYRWQNIGKLPTPLAKGAAVATPEGLICLGGQGPEGISSEVFTLQYSPAEKTFQIDRDYPPLPEACDYLAATKLGETLYVAGGRSADGPMKNFWALDLSSDNNSKESRAWRSLPAWPGPARFGAILTTQSDGAHDCLYLFGGKSTDNETQDSFLTDGYRFDPKQPMRNKLGKQSPRCHVRPSSLRRLPGDNRIYWFWVVLKVPQRAKLHPTCSPTTQSPTPGPPWATCHKK